MPLKSYGVLTARVLDARREGATDSPHYRAAVNVQSQQEPSNLLYLLDDDFKHPLTQTIAGTASGWRSLASTPGGSGLDYIRANLFDPSTMRALPPDLVGPDNDLADLLDHYVQRASGSTRVIAHIFGERWGPERGRRDKVFGFAPGNGVHDVHMNQGNVGQFVRDDGVWQDGGLLLHLLDEDRWVAVFLAFQSQAWHTDDVLGHAIDVAQPRPTGGSERVRIVAALVNPVGPAPEAETVTLINASPAPIDLTGWTVADRLKRSCKVPSQTLPSGATLMMPVSDGVALGNSGGIITLLDPGGLKVHGVSYSSEQARAEGWTVVF